MDDLHATSLRSSRRRFITAEHLLVRRSSGTRIDTQPETSQGESPAGFRPTLEQLTWGTQYDAAKKNIFLLIVAASGEADTGVGVLQS